MTQSSPARSLSAFRYASLSLACGMPQFLMGLYFVKFATDELHLAPAFVGVVFGASRVWDAVSDPLLAGWSDRGLDTGRRLRPIGVGGALLAVSVLGLWLPAPFDGPYAQEAWTSAAVFLYFTAHTLVFVPYDALGIELTTGAAQRNRWFAARALAYSVAMGAGVLLLQLTDGSSRRGLFIAGVGAVAIAVGTWSFVRAVRPQEGTVTKGDRRPVLRGFRDIWRSPPSRAFFAVRFAHRTGMATMMTLGPFVVGLYLGDDSLLPMVMGTYVVAMVGIVPAIPRLAARVGTRPLWIGSMVAMASGLSVLFVLPRFSTLSFLAVVAAVALAGSIQSVTERTVLASIASRLSQTASMEARFSAVDAFLSKTAYGLATSLAGIGLQAAGYSPDMEMSGAVETPLRWVVSILPAFGLALAVWFARGVPSTDELTSHR